MPLALSILEEHLDAVLELLIVAPQLAMDHRDDLVVVLDAQDHIVDVPEHPPVRSNLKLLHLFLEGLPRKVRPPLEQDVHPGQVDQVGEAEADEIDQVALVVLQALLGYFEEEVGDGQELVDPAGADLLPYFVLLVLQEVVDEGYVLVADVFPVVRYCFL